jgi:hypothetical protein
MCGCDTDFEELERTPCEVCGGAGLPPDELACGVAG